MDYWGSIGIATLVFAVLGAIFTFIPFMKDRGFVSSVAVFFCFFVHKQRVLWGGICVADSAASLCGQRLCACGSCGSARTLHRSTLSATRSSRRLPTTNPRRSDFLLSSFFLSLSHGFFPQNKLSFIHTVALFRPPTHLFSPSLVLHDSLHTSKKRRKGKLKTKKKSQKKEKMHNILIGRS